MPPQIQRMRSDDLWPPFSRIRQRAATMWSAVDSDHPLVNGTIRDSLHEAMDLED